MCGVLVLRGEIGQAAFGGARSAALCTSGGNDDTSAVFQDA